MSQPLLYDWSGKPVSSAAAPITGRPTQALSIPQGGAVVLGSDYADTPCAQAPKVDAQGNQYVIAASALPQGATAANLLRQPLTTSAGNASLLVNGSVYSQTFYWVPATATASYVVTGIYVVMTAATLSFSGKYFGGAATLSRGLLLQASQASVLTTLATITVNEDLLGFNGEVTPNLAGATDLLTARLRLQHPIAAGSGDGVQVIVRDNLTATNMPTYLRVYVEGIRLTA